MAQNDLQLSNENTHSRNGSEEDSMDICDNTLEASQESKPDRSRRKGSDVQLKQSTLEGHRHDSSPQESYMQDIPLDFSMPKRKDDLDSLSNSPKHEVHSPFMSSSPPHTMVSGRNSSSIYNECGATNGCVSPADMPSEHILSGPCDNKSDAISASLVNGQLIDAGMSSDFLLRERSHSFSSSSLHKQRHHAIPQQQQQQRQPRSGVWRSSAQLRAHHMNETALMSAIAANTVGYSDLISPHHPSGCSSPLLGNVQSVGNEEVLSLYKDHMHKLGGGVDKHRYTFLASGIPSCVTESNCGNSIIASLPNMLAPSMPSIAGRHPTATASATASTNCISSSITPPSITSTSSSCTMVTTTPAKRRPRSLPDNQKDEAYWERRRKNNEAAKRSRDARRMKEEEIALRASYLEQENLKLKVEVASLKTETAKLKCLLFNS